MGDSVADQSCAADSLLALGRWLQGQGYAFTTVTPATQARVNARVQSALATNLREVFGWSRAFEPSLLNPEVLGLMRTAGLLDSAGEGLVRSKVRYSSLGGLLFAHSAYPTTDADAVFFGPDTVRFAAMIESELQGLALPRGARILDMGCGAGPGGIVAARQACSVAPQLVLADINARALQHACANASLAGIERVTLAQGDLFAAVDGAFDLILSNPPYLNDSAQRIYRHGGGAWGGQLSERIVAEGLRRLAPGGRLLLYTGSAMVNGGDPLLACLQRRLADVGWRWRYRELDQDVFGEELEQAAYAGAERIAAVSLVVHRPAT